MTYALSESGVDTGSPVELYEFVYQNVYLRYTSGINPVMYSGQTYTPFTIKRGPISSKAASVEQPLEITAFRDFPPAQMFRVQAPSAVLYLTVRRFHLLDSAAEFSVVWIGRVLNSAWASHNEVKLQCESDLASMVRLSLRRPYQLSCPYALYGAGCNVVAAIKAITVTSFSAVGRAVTVPGVVTKPDGYFAGGYLTYPSTLTGIVEVFGIRASSAGVMQLALTPFGIDTAAAMTLFAGCNHTMAVCDEDFGNLDNYGGQPFIPGTNPFAGTQLF